MATPRNKKKEQIDVHPKKVQNPYERLKRSPGKFDQRVFKEQDLLGLNQVNFYKRLYSTQHNFQMHRHDKNIDELRKRSVELKELSEEYTYLNALRVALRREKQRRLSVIQESPYGYNLRTNEAQSAPQPSLPEVKEIEASPEVKGTSDENQSEKGEEDEETSNRSDIMSPQTSKNAKELKKRRPVRAVTPNRLSTLESLSFELMTNTLPVSKLKRVMPKEPLAIRDKWPILSNYRKKVVFPSVKEGKQQMEEDMNNLHKKLNEYFECENFPLWKYKYIPKEQPRKYKLLKAIETDGIKLPTIPK